MMAAPLAQPRPSSSSNRIAPSLLVLLLSLGILSFSSYAVVLEQCGLSTPFASNTAYTLSADLATDESACFIVFPGLRGVSIDCQGHSITGSGGSGSVGLDLLGVSDATVRNCRISGFERALSLSTYNGQSPRGGLVEGNTLKASGPSGSSLYLGGSGAEVRGNTLAGQDGAALRLAPGSSANLAHHNLLSGAVWVEDGGSSNALNTTNGTAPQGNTYLRADGRAVWESFPAWHDADGDGYADSGRRDYPLSASTAPAGTWAGPAADWAPYTLAPQAPSMLSLRFDLVPRPGMGRGILNSIGRASDPNGDPLDFEATWTLDGQPSASRRIPLGYDGASSPAAELDHVLDVRKHQVWTLSVRAFDATSSDRFWSEPLSATYTVPNAPPALLSMPALPALAFADDPALSVDPSGLRATDPDGDSVRYAYRWLVDGQPAGEDSPTLPSRLYRAGQTVALEISPTDGEGSGPALRTNSVRIRPAPDLRTSGIVLSSAPPAPAAASASAPASATVSIGLSGLSLASDETLVCHLLSPDGERLSVSASGLSLEGQNYVLRDVLPARFWDHPSGWLVESCEISLTSDGQPLWSQSLNQPLTLGGEPRFVAPPSPASSSASGPLASEKSPSGLPSSPPSSPSPSLSGSNAPSAAQADEYTLLPLSAPPSTVVGEPSASASLSPVSRSLFVPPEWIWPLLAGGFALAALVSLGLIALPLMESPYPAGHPWHPYSSVEAFLSSTAQRVERARRWLDQRLRGSG